MSLEAALLVSCPGKDGDDECQGEFEWQGTLDDRGSIVDVAPHLKCPNCGRRDGFAVRVKSNEEAIAARFSAKKPRHTMATLDGLELMDVTKKEKTRG